MEGQKVKERVHIVTPENIDSFGHHNLSLTTHLLYSPKTLLRVQNLLKGKEAYILPGVVSRDDITLADKLGEFEKKKKKKKVFQRQILIKITCNGRNFS